MSWRIIHVGNESRLSLKQNNLSLIQGDQTFSLPLEDIGVLLVENRGTLLTGALLNACVQHKITVFICDEKYMPSGVLLGYQQHSRQVSAIKKQLQWSLPFKKQLWKKIVEQKILNQSEVFRLVKGEKSLKIQSYVNSVQSGDTTNREGAAAREYFQNILDIPAVRSFDNHINAALNYGYAVIRGVTSRSLSSYGFLTSVGIHHDSELNNFNLADDIIEPYRPYIDRFVFQNISNVAGSLTKEDRISIVNLLTEPVVLLGKTYSLQRAIEITVQSLVTSTDESDPIKLLLPTL
ncbi:MAG: subtype II CRISPR-associated endonuclease Cas1 [Parcubacteria group bacterium CG11_big_fil_rev_8_21_14_0_20_39_22]|nr:MAG: subtype II CRISPR-associated endonuclease Cas1 [Parcubacteria group bacterium CG11_big_fil_rev_8_21_14_0_20_39_22]